MSHPYRFIGGPWHNRVCVPVHERGPHNVHRMGRLPRYADAGDTIDQAPITVVTYWPYNIHVAIEGFRHSATYEVMASNGSISDYLSSIFSPASQAARTFFGVAHRKELLTSFLPSMNGPCAPHTGVQIQYYRVPAKRGPFIASHIPIDIYAQLTATVRIDDGPTLKNCTFLEKCGEDDNIYLDLTTGLKTFDSLFGVK